MRFEFDATIRDWSIPSPNATGTDHVLAITVEFADLGIRETYYRVHEYQEGNGHTRLAVDRWHWRRWSAANTPTVPAPAAACQLCDQLVLHHPDLSRLAHLFGLDMRDAPESAS